MEATREDAYATIRATIFARLVGTMPPGSYDFLEQAVDEAVEAMKEPTISWVYERLSRSD